MSNLSVASHNLAAKLLDLIKAMPTDKYDALNAKYKDYVAAVEVAKAAMVKAKEDNDNDNGVACERCGDTTCEEDSHYNCRLLWNSNKTGKQICRRCVGEEDRDEE